LFGYYSEWYSLAENINAPNYSVLQKMILFDWGNFDLRLFIVC